MVSVRTIYCHQMTFKKRSFLCFKIFTKGADIGSVTLNTSTSIWRKQHPIIYSAGFVLKSVQVYLAFAWSYLYPHHNLRIHTQQSILWRERFASVCASIGWVWEVVQNCGMFAWRISEILYIPVTLPLHLQKIFESGFTESLSRCLLWCCCIWRPFLIA